jgi:type IV secretory pathway VirB10-like protein
VIDLNKLAEIAAAVGKPVPVTSAPKPAPEPKPEKKAAAPKPKPEPTKPEAAPKTEAKPAPKTEAKPAPIQIPPGLPQSYVDVNLQEQAVPQALAEEAAQEQKKPMSYEITPGVVTMCHRDCISYRPGPEGRLTQERIDQGPRVFVSRVQKAAYDRGEHEEETIEPKGPTLAHPDTLRPGTYVKGESAPYRPGA